MALSVELAKVVGTVRCNRWSQNLEGGDSGDNDGSLLMTLPQLVRHTRAYADRLREEIDKGGPRSRK